VIIPWILAPLYQKDRHATKKIAPRETAVPLARISRWNGSEVADHGGRWLLPRQPRRGRSGFRILDPRSFQNQRRWATSDPGAGPPRAGWTACGVRSALDSSRDRTHQSRVVFSTSISLEVCASRAGLGQRLRECSPDLPRCGTGRRLAFHRRGAPFRGRVGRSSRTSPRANSRDEDCPYGRLSSLFSSSFFAECLQ
jgi:hypothetical protein